MNYLTTTVEDLKQELNSYSLTELINSNKYEVTGKYGTLTVGIPRMTETLTHLIPKLLYRMENTQRLSQLVLHEDNRKVNNTELKKSKYPNKSEEDISRTQSLVEYYGTLHNVPVIYYKDPWKEPYRPEQNRQFNIIHDSDRGVRHGIALYHAYLSAYHRSEIFSDMAEEDAEVLVSELLNDPSELNKDLHGLVRDTKYVIHLIETETYVREDLFNRIYTKYKKLEKRLLELNELIDRNEIDMEYEYFSDIVELSTDLERVREELLVKQFGEEGLQEERDNGRYPRYDFGAEISEDYLPNSQKEEDREYVVTTIVVSEGERKIEVLEEENVYSTFISNTVQDHPKALQSTIERMKQQINAETVGAYSTSKVGYSNSQVMFWELQNSIRGRFVPNSENRKNTIQTIKEESRMVHSYLQNSHRADEYAQKFEEDYKIKIETITLNVLQAEGNIVLDVSVSVNGSPVIYTDGRNIQEENKRLATQHTYRLNAIGGQMLFNALNTLITPGNILNYNKKIYDMEDNRVYTGLSTVKEIDEEELYIADLKDELKLGEHGYGSHTKEEIEQRFEEIYKEFKNLENREEYYHLLDNYVVGEKEALEPHLIGMGFELITADEDRLQDYERELYVSIVRGRGIVKVQEQRRLGKENEVDFSLQQVLNQEVVNYTKIKLLREHVGNMRFGITERRHDYYEKVVNGEEKDTRILMYLLFEYMLTL